MKQALPILLKLAVTSVLLGWIFREHHFRQSILPHLQTVGEQWPWAFAGLASVWVSIWLSAVRWHVLLRGQELLLPHAEVMRVTMISQFFNITSLGVVGGDAYRVIALMKQPNAKKLPLMVSVLLDHLAGLVGLGLLFLTCRAVYADRVESLSLEVKALVKGYEMFMAGSLFFVVLSAISFTPRLYAWGEKQWPWMLGYAPLKNFAQACDALRRDWRGSLFSVFLSVILFLAHFMSFYCALRAVGGAAPFWDVMATMPIVDTVSGLPISVSGLGVREKTFEVIMGALSGLEAATAISASLVGWLMGVLWGLWGGFLFILRGQKLAELLLK